MNNKKKQTMAVIIGAYVLVILLFFSSIFYVPAYYNKLQDDYIVDAQSQLATAFEQVGTASELKSELDQIVANLPMELIVFRNGETVYNTMIPVENPAELHEGLDQRVTLMQGNGTFSVNNNTYEIWYNLYQVQVSAFLFNITVVQIILLGLAALVLFLAVFLLQRMLVSSLDNLKITIGKMEQYELNEVISAQTSDVLNSKMKGFAQGLKENISRQTQKEAELTQEVYVRKEQVLQSQMISRAFIHDLKTPIHQTLLENESLLEVIDADNVEARKIVEFNIQRADSALRSINEVLASFHLGEIGSDFSAETFDLAKLISEIRKTFAAFLREKGIVLHIEIPERLIVSANRTVVKLLIHNIFSNAIQYSLTEGDIYIDVYQNANGAAVFECTNESSAENISWLQGDIELQSFTNRDNIYSSANGIVLIKSLAESLNASYEQDVDDNKVTVRIVFAGGEQK